jgi:pSer/pThr/pTyr-binding forkhead associated (FHA) protein
MQLVLKPVSQPELGDIIVNDTLFAIGRHEEPFAGFDSKLVTRLSRRHARIFEQDGVVYLADLGSLNGTQVNGRPVDKIPLRLRSGDELCFAGLCYQAEILGAAAARAAPPPAAPLELVLQPQSAAAQLEPVVVTQFPFLVNKKSKVFSRYAEQLADQIRYLSRRHAHIFVRNNSLYIEDLGSTNGTYVSGERLEEHARELHTGDLIAFGGDCFVYRVELVYPQAQAAPTTADPTSHVASQAQGIEDVTRTTFVTSANSFLDIFCIEDAPDEQQEGEPGTPLDAQGADNGAVSAAPVRGWRAPFSRLGTALREVRGALAEDRPKRPRRRWLAAVGLVAGAGVALAVYLNNAPQRQIRALLDEEDYRRAALAASAYMERHGGHDDVSEVATEAVLKATVPDWSAAVMAGDFATAEDKLQSGRRLAAFNPKVLAYFDTMEWVTGLEQFMAERGGQQAPLVMFAQEERIGELLAWWEADPNAHHRSLSTLVQQAPVFAELRARVFSHQRTLQSHKALDLAAIERLTASVAESLQQGQAQQLAAALSEFESRYPRIMGTQQLRDDLDRYLPIEAAIAAGDWLTVHAALGKTQFATPPFEARAAFIGEQLLPPPAVLERYREASQAWLAGDTERAAALLEDLAATRWGEPAKKQLERNRKLAADYARLGQSRDDAEYPERLLAFYSELDPARDGHYVGVLKDQFERHRGQALERAREAFEDAHAGWKRYLDAGGIRGLHRLEADVSSSFRRLAAMLSESYADIQRATRLFDLLNARHPEAWDTLYTRIRNEVRLQRRSLAELSMVLEPSLKQAKLELIPVLQPEQPERVSSQQANQNK